MPHLVPSRLRSSRRGTALVAALAAFALGAADAHAHGGVTLVDGTQDGVTLLLQATEATTDSGAPAADVSLVLGGPGTGASADVVFWVRPEGGETFKVEPQRDRAGVHHYSVATAGRGAWRDWDVSAVVTLTDGDRVSVTNAPSSPPGPDPAAKTPAEEPSASSPSTPDATTPADETAAVADISGESDGAPAWAVPSLLVIFAAGIAVMVWQRRRRED